MLISLLRADVGNLVTAEIVHDDDIAVPQGWNKTLFDIGEKALAIHGSIEHTGRGDLVEPQGGDEGRCADGTDKTEVARLEQGFP